MAHWQHEVVVIGAGFSGIGMGIRLRRAGFHDFVILERARDLGGTWRDATYPGVAVDIPAFTYSFSFEQNPRWSRTYATGAELHAYAHHCATKYGLRPHLRFESEVARIVFDEARDQWMVVLRDGSTLRARFVVCATGALTQPKKPDIPGIDSFAGVTVHSGRWDHGVVLDGKRVAMIGTGASAVQLLPALAPRARRIHVFQRTPIWVLPKRDAPIPPWRQALFRYLPPTQWLVRARTSLVTELIMTLGIVYHKQVPGIVRRAEQLSLAHLRRQLPDPELRRKLTPSYGFGCKRPAFSNDYWRSFRRDDVELVTEPIERITPTGIVTADGHAREVDALVLATGYKVFEPGNFPPFEVVGVGGVELGAFWRTRRFQAYQGATIPGFPNYFTILGPYSTSGSSWFSMIEAQTRHALRCIRHARRRGATRVEVRQGPHDRYFARVLRRQQNTVFFNNGCATANSYYFDAHGDAPFLRPSSGVELWWDSWRFPLRHYRFTALPDPAGPS